MRVYTRTTRREIRIIGSNDGSRGTGAGKSQRLSLLVAIPFFLFSFLFLLFVATKQRQPNEAKTARGTPVASGSLFSSASNALAPLLRPSDCSVYCTSTTIPRLEKIDHEETNLAVYIRLSLSLSAISFGLYTRKRTFHAYQSNLFYRQEDLIGFIERMNGRLEGERTTVRSILNDTGLVQDS